MADAQKMLAWNLLASALFLEEELGHLPPFSRLASFWVSPAPLMLVHLGTEPFLAWKVAPEVSSTLTERMRDSTYKYVWFSDLGFWRKMLLVDKEMKQALPVVSHHPCSCFFCFVFPVMECYVMNSGLCLVSEKATDSPLKGCGWCLEQFRCI